MNLLLALFLSTPLGSVPTEREPAVITHQQFDRGEHASAVDASSRRSDFPSHAAAEHWLGRVNEYLGNIDAAQGAYGAALALDPGRKPSRDALSRLGATGLRKIP